MINPSLVLAVAAGGAMGAAARYSVAQLAIRWFGTGFPWGTLFVNIAGSLLMGLIFESFTFSRISLPSAVQLFMMTGILGGFTTFSAFSLEAITMLSQRDYMSALLYVSGSVFLSLIGVIVGIWLVRLVLA